METTNQFLSNLIFRARATNTQLGQEENSAFTYLEVYGEDGADVPPEIIVAPKDTEIVKGTQVTELQVIRLSHLSLETISV